MSKGIDNILKRSGTGQVQRFLKALDPATFDLHDFTTEDWLLFAHNFAKNVQYYNSNNEQVPSDDWQDFFSEFNKKEEEIESRTNKDYKKLSDKITQTLTEYKEEHNLTPHLTLFVCFLQLLEFSKDRFNKLTKRHLDFYYNKVLQVDKLAPLSDQVHVLFEIAKRSSEELVEKGTELNAGQDKNAAQRIYKTDDQLVTNKAQIASLKTVYSGKKYTNPDDVPNGGRNPFEFKMSQVANTLDGLEEPLAEDSPYWYPFGYTSGTEEYMELENTEVGFAISSPMLELHEGLRTVILTINFKDEGDDDENTVAYTPETLKEVISVQASGEEDWIDPIELRIDESEEDSESNTESDTDEEAENVSTEHYTEALSKTALKLVFQLTQEDDAVMNYNPEFLLKKYDTQSPAVRFVIDTGSVAGLSLYKELAKRVVEKIAIRVEVEDAKNVIAENDNGLLKTAKPFYPFTPQPMVGSNFSVNYPEAFAKNWDEFEVRFTWKDAPSDFSNWYAGYLKSQELATSKLKYEQDAIGGEGADTTKIINTKDDFIATKSILYKDIWRHLEIEEGEAGEPEGEGLQFLFQELAESEENPAGGYECIMRFSNLDNSDIGKSGPVRMTLQQSFLHKLYPRLYAISLMSRNEAMPIPNEPYTPVAENISINYSAEEEITIQSKELPIEREDFDIKNATKIFDARRIQLFHEHPFGLAEEHNFLKVMNYIKGIRGTHTLTRISTHLVPKYCQGGHLFIGLENAEALQSVSLLIQVLEGSENPLVTSFLENESVQWSVLCNNGWKNLKGSIISDNTDNFLSSGIIKISLPREASKDNTLMPENLIWLKVEMNKTYDAVCKVLNIHTQAVVATFENNENDVSHLETGLPSETIKKLITRVPQIRSVSQPYNSFGGTPEESDEHFYRRISERLRHKKRAITLWDYEHLILQKYPEIYKVKCLNHTSDNSFHAAGHVSIVVIPDTVNKNVFDKFEPRVSQGLINKVQEYINTLNSLHVDAKVINPNYEKVNVSLEVQFYEGYDKSFYSDQLEKDIIKFLSPWAYDDTKEVEFGITLHKSVLIDYLEKLEYVDYLQNVVITKGDNEKPLNSVSPSNPKSILVSAKEHDVRTVLSNCKGIIKEPKNVCQV
jgi:hypothetical protein